MGLRAKCSCLRKIARSSVWMSSNTLWWTTSDCEDSKKGHYKKWSQDMFCILHPLIFIPITTWPWNMIRFPLPLSSAILQFFNKLIIFVFHVHKKYLCSFITLRLNHWCYMDYFNDVLLLTTFLGLECGSCVAVYSWKLCWVRKLLDFNKNILFFVNKMNESHTDLERHEGV